MVVAGDLVAAHGAATPLLELVEAALDDVERARNALREFYPAAPTAFEALHDRNALAVLSRPARPGLCGPADTNQLKAALRAGGRRRNLEATAGRIQALLPTDRLHAQAAVASA